MLLLVISRYLGLAIPPRRSLSLSHSLSLVMAVAQSCLPATPPTEWHNRIRHWKRISFTFFMRFLPGHVQLKTHNLSSVFRKIFNCTSGQNVCCWDVLYTVALFVLRRRFLISHVLNNGRDGSHGTREGIVFLPLSVPLRCMVIYPFLRKQIKTILVII